MSGHEVVVQRLRELNDAYAARTLDREADARLERTLEQRALQAPIRARLRWWPVLAFAAGAVVMGIGLRSQQRDPHPEPTPIATLEAKPVSTCDSLKDEVRGLSAGECREGDGVRVDALAASIIRRTGTSFEVSEGKVMFDVEPRGIDLIHVYAGPMVIEVKGTRFVVEHDASGGAVVLLEGRVEVTMGESPPREITAGERMEWASPGVAPTSSAQNSPGQDSRGQNSSGQISSAQNSSAQISTGQNPSAQNASAQNASAQNSSAQISTGQNPSGQMTSVSETSEGTAPRRRRPIPSSRGKGDLETLLQEVNRLRRAHEFKRAIELLDTADTAGWNARERLVISYEIGTLLERQVRDFEAACAHWLKNRDAFTQSRYQELVDRSVERMKCEIGEKK